MSYEYSTITYVVNAVPEDTTPPEISYTSIANQYNESSVPSSIDFLITDNVLLDTVTYLNWSFTWSLTWSWGIYSLSLENSIWLHEYIITAKDSSWNESRETITYDVVSDLSPNINILWYTISNLSWTGVTISWETDLISNESTVDFFANWSSLLNQVATINGTGNVININNLELNETYTVKIKSKIAGQDNYTDLQFSFSTADSNNSLYVRNISRISHWDIVVWGNFTNWYHFRFEVTNNNLSETGASLKFDDWSNWAWSLAILWNSEIIVSEKWYDDYASASWSTIGMTNNYGTMQAISWIDWDSTKWWRQFVIDVFYKIPAWAAWSYSTNYWVKTQ